MTPQEIEAERERLEQILSEAMKVHEASCESMREATNELVRSTRSMGEMMRRRISASFKRRIKRINERLRRIFCAALRHSPITSNCMGYQHCARCGELLGDVLAGAFSVKIGLQCGCEECQTAYQKLGWFDKFLVPKPEWLGWTPQDWKAHCDAERKRLFKLIEQQNRRMREESTRVRPCLN